MNSKKLSILSSIDDMRDLWKEGCLEEKWFDDLKNDIEELCEER